MKTLVVEHEQSIYFTAPVHVSDPVDHAEGWDVPDKVNPGIRWIAGNFVESGNPNSNGQYWTASDLALGEYTITYSPLNLLHRFRTPVGFFHSTRRTPSRGLPAMASLGPSAVTLITDPSAEIVRTWTGPQIVPNSNGPVWISPPPTPTTWVTTNTTNVAAAEQPGAQPGDNSEEFVIQFLAGMWTHIFPEEFATVRSASDSNRLFASMECVGSRLHCTGEKGCEEQFDYFDVDSHCAHLRERTSVRHIVDPVFRGGGLIIPPVRPGWKGATASVLADELASLLTQAESTQSVYESWNRGGYDLTTAEWEQLMAQVVATTR